MAGIIEDSQLPRGEGGGGWDNLQFSERFLVF